ncbi:hypothetical protein [Methylovirgula ligni]|nr:hypothetical protein [Methylovirgula ligni]
MNVAIGDLRVTRGIHEILVAKMSHRAGKDISMHVMRDDRSSFELSS